MVIASNIVEETDEGEPRSYKEDVKSKNIEKWIKTMNEGMSSLNKNGTWILVDKLDQKKLLSCKWVFKKKATDSWSSETQMESKTCSHEIYIGRRSCFTKIILTNISMSN